MGTNNTKERQILLVGATGTVGSLVLRELMSQRVPVRVLVRPEWLQRRMFQRLLPSYRPKFRIGEQIAASKDAVILSPTNFYQNDETFIADIVGGAYPMPLRHANRVDFRDVAELAAAALLDPAYPAGEHLIAGPASYSGQECADIW